MWLLRVGCCKQYVEPGDVNCQWLQEYTLLRQFSTFCLYLKPLGWHYVGNGRQSNNARAAPPPAYEDTVQADDQEDDRY